MESKTIEIRDRGTFIPALAVRLHPSCEKDRYLLARGGFGRKPEDQASYIVLVYFAERRAEYDPFAWGDRTLRVAHQHVLEHWAELRTGAVVDVEFILGETSEPKQSEALR